MFRSTGEVFREQLGEDGLTPAAIGAGSASPRQRLDRHRAGLDRGPDDSIGDGETVTDDHADA